MNTVAINRAWTKAYTRPLLEVGISYALIEGALWSRGLHQLAWAVATLAFVSFSSWRAHRGPSDLGINTAGFRRSMSIIPLTLSISGMMFLAAYFAGSLHGLTGVHAPLWHALLYSTWALIQEFLTLSFMFVRLEDVFGSPRAILITSLLFSLAHIPNLTLMIATLLIGLLFSWSFQRSRNIYPIAISHAILGLTLSVTLSPAVTHNMRVGIAYFL